MATSKALNRNRLKIIFVNVWKLFYCFPNVYFYLNGNSEDLLFESFAVSNTPFNKGPKSYNFPPTCSHVQTPHFTSLFVRNTPLERPLSIGIYHDVTMKGKLAHST